MWEADRVLLPKQTMDSWLGLRTGGHVTGGRARFHGLWALSAPSLDKTEDEGELPGRLPPPWPPVAHGDA